MAIAQIVALYGSCICKYSTDTFVVFEHQAYSPFKRADEGKNDDSKNDDSKNEDAEKLESGKLSSTPKGLFSQGSNDQIENTVELNQI